MPLQGCWYVIPKNKIKRERKKEIKNKK